MSTLTSAQLHVKRSSTRLHAPPGGASSLSFGPGGFGTIDTIVEKKEPHEHTGTYDSNLGYNNDLPQYSRGDTGSSKYQGIPSNNCSMRSNPALAQYSSGSNSCTFDSINNNSNYNHAPPPSAYTQAPYRPQPTPGAYQQHQPNAQRPYSTSSRSSSSSWGAQPPLTSSKRDQNWEKKRRQWLARKNGGTSACGSARSSTSSSGYTSSGGYGGAYFTDDPIQNPPSPLSKFMAQQSQKQMMPNAPLPQTDYERIPTAYSSSSYTPSTAAGLPRTAYLDESNSSYPYQPPPPSSSGRMRSPPSTTAEFYTAGGYSRQSPSTAMSSTSISSSTTRAGSRQPPGGHTQWSPFS